MENTIYEPEQALKNNVNVVAVIESQEDDLIRINEYCESQNVDFVVRPFNRFKSEDRNIIKKLPAFHIYVKKAYKNTFYLDTQPYKHINECIEFTRKKESNRKRQKNIWTTLLSELKKSINRIFNKKKKILDSS
jgi:hypothetical protein